MNIITILFVIFVAFGVGAIIYCSCLLDLIDSLTIYVQKIDLKIDEISKKIKDLENLDLDSHFPT
jgi:hypothetical protein